MSSNVKPQHFNIQFKHFQTLGLILPSSVTLTLCFWWVLSWYLFTRTSFPWTSESHPVAPTQMRRKPLAVQIAALYLWIRGCEEIMQHHRDHTGTRQCALSVAEVLIWDKRAAVLRLDVSLRHNMRPFSQRVSPVKVDFTDAHRAQSELDRILEA